MLRQSLASRRDRGDFTPSSMLKRVIAMFEEAKSKADIASLRAFFLEVEAELGVDEASAIMSSRNYLNSIDYERSEKAKYEARDSLRASLTGSYEKVRSIS